MKKKNAKDSDESNFGNFDTSPLHQFSRFNSFLWVCWFWGKNLSIFVPPLENSTTRTTIFNARLCFLNFFRTMYPIFRSTYVPFHILNASPDITKQKKLAKSILFTQFYSEMLFLLLMALELSPRFRFSIFSPCLVFICVIH